MEEFRSDQETAQKEGRRKEDEIFRMFQDVAARSPFSRNRCVVCKQNLLATTQTAADQVSDEEASRKN